VIIFAGGAYPRPSFAPLSATIGTRRYQLKSARSPDENLQMMFRTCKGTYLGRVVVASQRSKIQANLRHLLLRESSFTDGLGRGFNTVQHFDNRHSRSPALDPSE
jgi:hypothetical protein